MKNAQADLAIAKLLGYPKDDIGVGLNLDGDCVLFHNDSTPCKRWVKSFSPTSDWKLAWPLLEKYGVNLEELILDTIQGIRC